MYNGHAKALSLEQKHAQSLSLLTCPGRHARLTDNSPMLLWLGPELVDGLEAFCSLPANQTKIALASFCT